MRTRPLISCLLVAALGLSSVAPAAVSFTTLISGLDEPIAFVDPADGLPHRFVAEQEGRIVVWDGASPGPGAVAMLDLRDDPSVPAGQRKVEYGGERGLLAMTAHPDYLANGYVYIYYTSRDWDGGGGVETGDIVIERYTRSSMNPESFDPATGHVVLVVAHPDGNHNGGDIEFGPDGFLYATLGDGGGGCDSTAGSGQDPNQLLGKMLRLDVDGADAYPGDPLKNYAIPAGNPLVGVAGLDEIWALGLRNPFRMNFDRSNGDIYVGDVGQDDWEEIDRLAEGAVVAGAPVNFGWPCREGFDPAGCGTPPQGCGATFTNPVRVEANAGEGGVWSTIMGGFRYRGARTASDLANRVVYGDAGNGEVWAATVGAPNPPEPGWASVRLDTGIGVYGFGEDQGGELYAISAWSGEIQCIHATGSDCTGWAALGDLFLDGFESAGVLAWSEVSP